MGKSIAAGYYEYSPMLFEPPRLSWPGPDPEKLKRERNVFPDFHHAPDLEASGKVVDFLYSTGERDKFRTRVERTPKGTEVYVTHRGMVEVYTGPLKETTVWQPRAADPQLEAEMLQRLMLKLGVKEEQAKAAVATAAAPTSSQPAHARVIEGQAAALQIDDAFDRAWRRVGLALDRSGFTVEDRDRAQGLYFVRYVDPALAGREQPGFFSRLFSTVTVLNSQGVPESGEAGKRIIGLLIEDLK